MPHCVPKFIVFPLSPQLTFFLGSNSRLVSLALLCLSATRAIFDMEFWEIRANRIVKQTVEQMVLILSRFMVQSVD